MILVFFSPVFLLVPFIISPATRLVCYVTSFLYVCVIGIKPFFQAVRNCAHPVSVSFTIIGMMYESFGVLRFASLFVLCASFSLFAFSAFLQFIFGFFSLSMRIYLWVAGVPMLCLLLFVSIPMNMVVLHGRLSSMHYNVQ